MQEKNYAYGKDGANLKNQRLNLQFCNDKEVFDKQRMFLFFKAMFMMKHKQISQNGRNLDVMFKASQMLEEPFKEGSDTIWIDALYDIYIS